MKRKLYVKGKCTLCRGKVLGCPYCDSEGLTYVEASDKLIIEILIQADQDLKKEISKKVLGIDYEAIMDLSSSLIID
jgi:hypothetical protein